MDALLEDVCLVVEGADEAERANDGRGDVLGVCQKVGQRGWNVRVQVGGLAERAEIGRHEANVLRRDDGVCHGVAGRRGAAGKELVACIGAAPYMRRR